MLHEIIFLAIRSLHYTAARPPSHPLQFVGSEKDADMSVEKVDTLVVGAGQAGVAMSEHLSKCGVPHLVLERHRIAERWRSERWDSLVANGPAWHDCFPGMEFPDAPDAFVHEGEGRGLLCRLCRKNLCPHPLRRGGHGSAEERRPARLHRENLRRVDRGQQCGCRDRGFPAPGHAGARSRRCRAHADPLQHLQESGSVAGGCGVGGRCRVLWGPDRGRTPAFGQARLSVRRPPRSSASRVSAA